MIQRQVFGRVLVVESAVAAFVFLVVCVLVAYAVVWRRAGRQPTASRRPERPVLEKCLYLYCAAPLLDLPAVCVVAAGRSAEGISMIVGMLPVGVAAAAVTWSWVNREERSAVHSLALSPGGDHHVSRPHVP